MNLENEKLIYAGITFTSQVFLAQEKVYVNWGLT
jgi:hypothetical protein